MHPTNMTHIPKQETRNGVLYFNPGSAGPRRFKLPVTVGKLILEGDMTCETGLHVGAGIRSNPQLAAKMFDVLADKLQATLADVRSRGTLTEDDILGTFDLVERPRPHPGGRERGMPSVSQAGASGDRHRC